MELNEVVDINTILSEVNVQTREETLEKLDQLGFVSEIAAKEHFFFEDITLINAYKI